MAQPILLGKLLLLLSLLLNLRACIPYYLPPHKLTILMIGSQSRLPYLTIANDTLGRIFKVYAFTEAGSLPCNLCERLEVYSHTTTNASKINKWNRVVKPWWGKPDEWWCAQERPIAALKTYLNMQVGKGLPEFLLVIDDDTWVNPNAIWNLTQFHNPSKPLYTGYRYAFFIGGGSGALISKHSLEALAFLEPGRNESWVDECFRHKRGGKWCYFHSDWVFGRCLYLSSSTKPEMNENFHQENCSDVPSKLTENTCHHLTHEEMGQAYRELFASPQAKYFLNSLEAFGTLEVDPGGQSLVKLPTAKPLVPEARFASSVKLHKGSQRSQQLQSQRRNPKAGRNEQMLILQQ